MNRDLRLKIVELAMNANEGHIPSSFSIVDVIDYIYGNVLKIDPKNPESMDRDYFILSKGHGALALYVVLNKFGLLSNELLSRYGHSDSILGGHPDRVSTDFIEASTGSLGHGFPFAVGVAIGSQVKKLENRVFALLGDGECHEGTVWEAANVAANQKLHNLVAIVDWNESAMQLMPIDNLDLKWKSFGWNTVVINGHSAEELQDAFSLDTLGSQTGPYVVITRNTKGKGVPLIEGHGIWHHKIPNQDEFTIITKALS